MPLCVNSYYTNRIWFVKMSITLNFWLYMTRTHNVYVFVWRYLHKSRGITQSERNDTGLEMGSSHIDKILYDKDSFNNINIIALQWWWRKGYSVWTPMVWFWAVVVRGRRCRENRSEWRWTERDREWDKRRDRRRLWRIVMEWKSERHTHTHTRSDGEQEVYTRRQST